MKLTIDKSQESWRWTRSHTHSIRLAGHRTPLPELCQRLCLNSKPLKKKHIHDY